MAKPGTKSKIDWAAQMDYVEQSISNGTTITKTCTSLGSNLSSLWNFLNHADNSDFSARIKAAMVKSAASFAEKGLEVLEQAKGGNMAEMSRAREIAQHYRWMAGKRNPREYGEKVQIDQTIIEKKQIFKIGEQEFEL